MKIKIHNREEGVATPQYIDRDWYNAPVTPCVEFCFERDADDLIFTASRLGDVVNHPDAEEGAFQAELWKHDVVEFFIATEDGSRYVEFNLSANGAWWSAVFQSARELEEGVECIEGVRCDACEEFGAWRTEARIPLSEFDRLGIDLDACRLAFCAIQNTPEQVFLTTAESLEGEPDFHQPDNWPCVEPDDEPTA